MLLTMNEQFCCQGWVLAIGQLTIIILLTTNYSTDRVLHAIHTNYFLPETREALTSTAESHATHDRRATRGTRTTRPRFSRQHLLK